MQDAVIPSTDELHPPVGPYAHALVAPAGARMLYISGQVGIQPDGVTPPTLAEQADQIFRNISAILKANGLGFEHIVKTTAFIVAGQNIAEVREVRARHFGNHQPCSTAVFVSALVAPQWLIEVEAIAVLA